MRKCFTALAVGVALLLGSTALADITFVPLYGDGANEGFNDPTLGAQRRTAFEHALGIWGQQFSSSHTGETITISATFDPLGSGVLGGAGSVQFFTDGSTTYGSALANHLSGGDLSGQPEIFAIFNSSFSDFYYGTDGNVGGSQWDFVTVVLHEVAHGMNFFDLINSDGTWNGGQPGIFDRFLEIGDGTNLDTMTDAQRSAAIRSGDLFWNGSGGIDGNGGTRPEMYAPSTYQGGSSVSHLDQTVHSGLLMTPGLFNGVAIHDFSALELGMFHDMGWTAIPEPAAIAIMGLLGLAALGRRRA